MGMLQRLCDVDADAYRRQMRLRLEVVWDSIAWSLPQSLLSPAAMRFPDGGHTLCRAPDHALRLRNYNSSQLERVTQPGQKPCGRPGTPLGPDSRPVLD